MVAPTISPSAQAFLSAVDTLAMAGLDDRGRCWTALVSGSAGIARATETSLRITAVRDDDPLATLTSGDSAGVIGIDMARRRRIRVNGLVLDAGASGVVVAVREAYGNCPKHIDVRRRIPAESPGERAVRPVLCDADLALIHATTTFFIGSVHPDRGADVSHRGGQPGSCKQPPRRCCASTITPATTCSTPWVTCWSIRLWVSRFQMRSAAICTSPALLRSTCAARTPPTRPVAT